MQVKFQLVLSDPNGVFSEYCFFIFSLRNYHDTISFIMLKSHTLESDTLKFWFCYTFWDENVNISSKESA